MIAVIAITKTLVGITFGGRRQAVAIINSCTTTKTPCRDIGSDRKSGLWLYTESVPQKLKFNEDKLLS